MANLTAMSVPAWLEWIRLRLALRRERRFWRRRVLRQGAAAVLHKEHGPAALAEVTARQKAELLPLLRAELSGNERVALDFGCGAGRFTPDLARTIGGWAIGVDPIEALLQLAPPAPAVEYRAYHPPRLPVESDSVDVVWIACVLCNITAPAMLRNAASEIDRVLRPGGLLFLIENTADKPPAPHVRYRSGAEYRALFPTIALRHVRDHDEMGERVSVLAGRKRETADG